MYELRVYQDYLDTPGPLDGELTEAQQRELKHGYYASVSFVDAQIGRLLAELDRLQLRESTIIVLWGDHGWKLGEHRSWCKQTNFEIDTRVPLLIHVPQRGDDFRSAHGDCDAVVESLDVYPTLCQLAGLPIPERLEGNSLVPLLQQPAVVWKNRAISQFPRRDGNRNLMGYALRTERYRYVEWLDRDSCETVGTELYDHESDPQENQNIGGSSEQSKRIADQSKLLWETIERPEPGKLAKPGVVGQKSKPPRPKLQIQNKGTNPIALFWLAPDGRRLSLGMIQPGRKRSINTTLGHRFQIGGEQGDVVTVKKPNEVILIESGLPVPNAATSENPRDNGK
jgi:hypothetical protein